MTIINYYFRKGENKKAEKIAQETVKDIETQSECAPIAYAHFLGILADKKKDVGKSDEALNLANKAYEYYKKAGLSANSIKFYETESLLGDIYFTRHELDNALTHYKKAEKIANVIFQNQPNNKTAEIYSKYVNTAMAKRDLNGALKDLNTLINMREKIYGANNIEVLSLYLQKANIYRGLNEKDLAENLYSKVEDIVSNNKHEGNLPSFYRDYYLAMSHRYNALGNREEAINMANKALEYTFSSKEKKETKHYISNLKK